MAPASRRQIISSETLAAFGASPIHASSASDDGNNHSESSAEPPIIGIKIGGWTIRTTNSSIGDEQSMDKLTSFLEDIANAPEDKNNLVRQRRLCPPEITFLNAFISLRLECNDNHDSAGNNITTSEIRFNAKDALSEWAEAHQSLETQPISESKYDAQEVLSQSSIFPNERKECRGVSILQTLDAKVWHNKSKSYDIKSDSDGATAHSSGFYYDWTYSSPYAGTILTNIDEKNEVKKINNRQLWQSLPKSQIPFHLLQDTSQPILLYDDIYLFEGDLHDNGESSLNIKIRVMPTCWYVLQRLFVRVDSVCVKCREIRYFCLLDCGTNNAALANAGNSNSNNCKLNTIYRDVTWREASWEELKKMNLPVDPSVWMEHSNGGVFGGNTISATIPSFAALLTKLPVVSPPADLHKHAYYALRCREDK